MLWVLGMIGAAVIGAILRWQVGELFRAAQFPWATLLVNGVGGFFMGFVHAQTQWPSGIKLVVGVGFLGAFTTFSAFAWDTIRLWENGQGLLALVNIFANNLSALGLCAVAYYWFHGF